MESDCEEDELDYLSTGVFQLPGEPAVVINGVPDVPEENGNIVPSICPSESDDPSDSTTETGKKRRKTGFGIWLVGREVQKKFGDVDYSGTVTEYDRDTGWYRVVYEDGDFEDLEWHELQQVLRPLDITISLKSLAQKIIRKSYNKSEHGSGKNVAGDTSQGAKTGGRRGRPKGSSSRKP